MILCVSQEYYGESVPIPFPATAEEVREELGKRDTGSQPLFIRGDGPVWHFEDRLDPAVLYQETGVEKLNRLAGLVDAMDLDAQKVFAGALRAESVNGLDDILDIASSLGRYEFIEGVTSDKELGGWLVEHGQAGVDFPKEVWPYLDYAGIGAAYYAGHGGAYTPNGYVKRREVVQTQKKTDRPAFALTLASPTDAVSLDLPASDDELEQAKRALGLDDLDSAAIRDVEIGYPWAHLLPRDAITLEDASVLAECVQGMTREDLRVFGAVLEVEEPCSFHEAGTIAIATYTGNATSSYVKGYVVTADYSGTVSRIALNKVRYVAIFEGVPLVPAEPEPTPEPTADVREPDPVQFHWAYVLAPLGVITAIGGGIGAALYIKKRREDGYENEEDSQ